MGTTTGFFFCLTASLISGQVEFLVAAPGFGGVHGGWYPAVLAAAILAHVSVQRDRMMTPEVTPLAKKKIGFGTVREIALAMPDVEESSTYGVSGAEEVRGRLLACPAIHKSAEPDTIAIRIEIESTTSSLPRIRTSTT